jgi:thiol-disulfide isomerase/thioredoxin
MTLHELDSAEAVNSFKSSNANTLICFSATWCGPCKASKPTYQDLAQTYLSDSTIDVKCGIAYEHNLAESIQEFQIKAFPTYVLYVNNGKENGRIQGVNFEGIKEMIQQAGCKVDLTEGNALGGTAGTAAVSMEEARRLRLAMFDKKKSATVAIPAAAPKGDHAAMDVDDVDKVQDVETKDTVMIDTDEAATAPAEVEMVDPTEKLSKEDIVTLTESMGFALVRAQKALINSNSGVEGAIGWLMAHQDDADIDDPIENIPKIGAVAQSYKCNECGKILSNMANLELHANKSGHSDFEESTQAVKLLTEEEKAKKIAEIKTLLKVKRTEREEIEKVADVSREIERREMGKTTSITKEVMEKQARQRENRSRKKAKDDFKKERARIKAELEKDRQERIANKGKLTSKLGINGYNPDAIQYDVESEAAPAQSPLKKLKASAAKIDDYITKISMYKAGGDGGKCLKILLTYIKNVVENPDEDKFKKINTENKVYKSRVKPFIGAKALLLAVGFKPNDGNDALVLADDANMDVINSTKDKLEAAHAAY